MDFTFRRLRLWLLVRPLQPKRRSGVTGHPPVAAGRQTDRADFRPVLQARTLELVGEEALDEDRQPAPHLSGSVVALELRLAREIQNLFRRGTVTQKMKKKEVVQLVRSDDGFSGVDRAA